MVFPMLHLVVSLSLPNNHIPNYNLTFDYSEDKYDILAVCDWGQKMAFYQLNGKQVKGR